MRKYAVVLFLLTGKCASETNLSNWSYHKQPYPEHDQNKLELGVCCVSWQLRKIRYPICSLGGTDGTDNEINRIRINKENIMYIFS